MLTHQDRSTKDAGSRTKSDTQITRPTTPKALTTRELARDHQNQNTARGQVAPHIGIPNGNFLRQPTCAFTTDATALARLEQSDDQRRASLSGSASSGGRSGNAGAGTAGPPAPYGDEPLSQAGRERRLPRRAADADLRQSTVVDQIDLAANEKLNPGTSGRALFFANGTSDLTLENLTLYDTRPAKRPALRDKATVLNGWAPR